jgi:hypothetical protein
MTTIASEAEVRSFARTLADEALPAARLVDGLAEDFEELQAALSALYPDDEDAFDRILEDLGDDLKVFKALHYIAGRATRALDGSRPVEPVESLSQLLGE